MEISVIFHFLKLKTISPPAESKDRYLLPYG